MGGVAGVIIAVRAVLKAGGPNSIYIAVALVIVFGGMGYFFISFYGSQSLIPGDCRQKAFPVRLKY